jgi:small-conductance mechanosensitive channel
MSHPSPRSKRQTFWERIWASTIVLYTFVATFVVWKTLGKYGVNPIGFFIVDLVTSWLYGISTARLVVAIFQKNRAGLRKYGIYSALNFAVPDVYIIAMARHVPRDVYLALAGVIALLAIFSIVGVLQQIKDGK